MHFGGIQKFSRLYSTIGLLVFCCCCNNYHTLSGLNSTNLLCYGSAAQESSTGLTRLKSRCLQDRVAFWRIWFFVFSSFQRPTTILGSWPPAPSSLLSQHGLSFLIHCHLCLSQTIAEKGSLLLRTMIRLRPTGWSHLSFFTLYRVCKVSCIQGNSHRFQGC